jgi:hypothetical protein
MARREFLGAATVAMALVLSLGASVRGAGRREVLRVESDAAEGTTAFKDSSPQAHALHRQGDVHHSEKHRKTGRSSIHFDGKGDCLTVDDGPAFSFGVDDFTVAAWVRPEGTGRRFLCGQAPRDGANVRASIGIAIEADGRLRASARSTVRTYLLYAPQKTYDDGEWHHISFRREGNELRLLVDDREHDRANIGPEPLNDSVEPFGIGRAGAFPTDPFRGYLDDFVITRQPRHVTDF